MKRFVKALDPAGAVIQHLRQMLSSLPDAKVSGGIFVGGVSMAVVALVLDAESGVDLNCC